MVMFNEEARCVKCGSEYITSNYTQRQGISGKIVELILRKCSRCGYSWNEDPLDKPQENKQ